MADSSDMTEVQTSVQEPSPTTMNKWKTDYHRYQEKPGWCGPAVWQMGHIAGGDKITTQEQIAKDIHYDESWGTSHTNMINYAKDKFSLYGNEVNSSIDEIESLIHKGKFVIVNYMAEDETGKGGHYAVVTGIDRTNNTLSLADPSNAKTKDGKIGLYEMNIDEFDKNWYDYTSVEDENTKTQTRGWLVWVDPITIKDTKQVLQ